MWNRKEVKEKGKANFKKNYGRSVLVALIYSIFFISTSSISSKTSAEQLQNNLETNPDFVYIFMATMAVLSALICIMTILDIFLFSSRFIFKEHYCLNFLFPFGYSWLDPDLFL